MFGVSEHAKALDRPKMGGACDQGPNDLLSMKLQPFPVLQVEGRAAKTTPKPSVPPEGLGSIFPATPPGILPLNLSHAMHWLVWRKLQKVMPFFFGFTVSETTTTINQKESSTKTS